MSHPDQSLNKTHPTLLAKRAASVAREIRKGLARRRIHHRGIMVDRHDVEGQRYLREHLLPYSDRVADVLLPKDRPTLKRLATDATRATQLKAGRQTSFDLIGLLVSALGIPRRLLQERHSNYAAAKQAQVDFKNSTLAAA